MSDHVVLGYALPPCDDRAHPLFLHLFSWFLICFDIVRFCSIHLPRLGLAGTGTQRLKAITAPLPGAYPGTFDLGRCKRESFACWRSLLQHPVIRHITQIVFWQANDSSTWPFPGAHSSLCLCCFGPCRNPDLCCHGPCACPDLFGRRVCCSCR